MHHKIILGEDNNGQQGKKTCKDRKKKKHLKIEKKEAKNSSQMKCFLLLQSGIFYGTHITPPKSTNALSAKKLRPDMRQINIMIAIETL